MTDKQNKKDYKDIVNNTILRLSQPRIPPLKESEMDENAIKLLKPAKALGRGKYLNIFSTLIRHPKLYKAWNTFGNYILGQSTLPAREREILILRIGWLCQSEYEWGQHVVIGKLCGLDDKEIKQIIKGSSSQGWSSFESALLSAVDELYEHSIISDATWSILSESYDEQQLIDLLFTVGQYQLVSMALNTLGIQLDEGYEGFPK